MNFLYIVLMISITVSSVYSRTNPKLLKCLVCRAVVSELEVMIAKENPKKMVDVGNYRLDSDGNTKQKKIPYARSEVHMAEVMENVCETMGDYVQATYKSTGKPLVLRLVTQDGKMNPEIGIVDITPDGELNKSLEFYCQSIVEEQEDNFLKLFAEYDEDITTKLCTEEMKCVYDPDDLKEGEGEDEEEEIDAEGKEEL